MEPTNKDENENQGTAPEGQDNTDQPEQGDAEAKPEGEAPAEGSPTE